MITTRLRSPFALRTALAVCLFSGPSALSHADDASTPVPPPQPILLNPVFVSVTPILMGTQVPISHVPSNIQTLRASQIDEDHTQTLTDAVDRQLASVTLDDTEGNPFQEDLVSRGFTSSPVLGTPQGLALYQNGVRVNEAFGDIVLWDFIPVFAIDELEELPGSNPVFGLNALGGAIALKMKDGFDYKGSSAEVTVGSYGRYRGTVQTGGTSLGGTAFYFGANVSHDDGWRQLSSSDVIQTFVDGAIRGDDYKLGLSLSLNWNRLNGNGADPAQDDRTAAFAVPDLESDHLIFLEGRGSKTFSDAISLQGTTYLRTVDTQIQNGAASGFGPCTSGPNVCDEDGNPLNDSSGNPIPATATYDGILPVATTHTLGLGGSTQLSLNQAIGPLPNIADAGISYDQANTHFSSITLLGNLVFLSPPGTTTDSDGEQLGGSDYNVQLGAINHFYGAFVTDTLSLTQALSVTAAARFNFAQLHLIDRFGDSLEGQHNYSRLNPSIGATYQIVRALNVYASYGESNRIPTAAELSCANPNQPCTFPLGFVSDPGLKQVAAHTYEFGVRGNGSSGDLSLRWFADVYDTRNTNDIIFVRAGPLIGSGFFQNSGNTQRLGAEASLMASWKRFDFHASFGLVRATYESYLTVFSDSNPGADANGDTFVKPGDRLPEIPMRSGKVGLGVNLPAHVHLALDGVFLSSQFLRGDEANLQKPLPGYGVLNARASWQVKRNVSIFFEGENILNKHYASFGLYSDPTGNGAFPQFTDPRFYTPGQPFGFSIGTQIAL